MKNKVLSVFLTLLPTLLPAQTVRPGVVLNEDSCYLYAVDPLPTVYRIITSVPLLNIDFDSPIDPNLHGEIDLTARYPASEGMTIYGIAVTSQNPLLANMYLDLSVIDSALMVNRLASASNSGPYILGNYKYEAYTHQGQYVAQVHPTYEYYFDRPIHIVTDSFYAGIRVVTSQPPYNEYKYFAILNLWATQTFYNITNIVDDSIHSFEMGTLGCFFPIVKLPCPRLEAPYLGANVGGMALFTWDTADGATYQIGISQGDDSSYSFVHLSDTLRGGQYTYTGTLPEGWYNAHLRQSCHYCFSGSDTSVWSRWGEGRRFYYTPDTTAIDPADLQPPTSDFLPTIHPNPTTGILNVELGNLNFEGTATLQLLDLEGRLLQEFQIPNSKFKNPDSKFRIQNSKFKIDITSLPSGTYLLRVVGERRTAVHKLVILKSKD